MYHYFEAITNNRGDALTNYFVGVSDGSGNTVSIYADTSLTPISSVSGVANMAQVDANGNVDFYVDVGTYSLSIYAPDAVTLIDTIIDVPMNIDMDTAATAVAAQTSASASAAAAATSATNAATSAADASSSASSASTSATNAASSATSAANSASSASGSASSAAASLAAMPASVTSIPNATAHASNRAALAVLSTSGGPAYLHESGREGAFVFMTAAQYNTLTGRTLTADVTLDTTQGVLVAPATDTTGASGAWVRRHQILRPSMFGAVGTVGNTATDDSAALNAMIAWIQATGAPNNFSGNYGISSGLSINPGAYGTDLIFELNWGKCNIFANAAISRVVSIQNCYRAEFPGQLHVRGTGYASDANTSWTCDVGVYLNNVSNSNFGNIICEGFGYTGVERENNPSQNDTNTYRKIEGVRIGSGCTTVSTRSRSANWSGATNSGSYGSNAQTTTVTVDNLPSAYAQTAAKQVLVNINGRLHYVTNINAGANTISFFPWLTAAEIAAPNTLTYHYGGAVVARGNDSNINQFGIIKANGCSTAIEMSTLYGDHVAILDAESCGSACRLAASPSSSLASGHIGLGYCEGNTFNIVEVGAPANFTVAGRPAATPPSKDVCLTAPLLTGDVFASTALSGISVAATEGWYKKLKVNQDVSSSNETLDFNKPATFEVPVYRPPNGIQTLSLVAPDVNLRQQYRLDAAQVVVMGNGTNGQPTTVTFTTPNVLYANCTTTNGSAVVTMASTAGLFATMPITGTGIPGSTTILSVDSATQITLSANATASGTVTLTVTPSINGAFTSAAFSGFDRPAIFSIYNDGSNRWTVGFDNRLVVTATAAIGYGTGSGGTVTQSPAKSSSVQLNKPTGAITMSNAALGANTAVSFTLNNSLIAADDELMVRVKSGYATAATYRVRAEGNASGSRTIILENVSAGSLSEAVVIGFILVKGASA